MLAYILIADQNTWKLTGETDPYAGRKQSWQKS